MDLMTEQRQARRAHILESARRLIAERGYHAVTVRDLAERCRVSVPTLYNQFGGKDALLGAAIEDHFNRALLSAQLPKAQKGLPRLLAIIDGCAAHIVDLDDYHRRLLEAFGSLEATTDIQLRMARRLVAVMSEDLSELKRQRRLAPWVEVKLLAGQINSAVISSAMIWSGGHWANDHLLAGMRYATGMVLLGALRGVAAKNVEARIIQSQQGLLAAEQASRKISTLQRRGPTHNNIDKNKEA